MDRLFQLTTRNLLGALNLTLVVLCAWAASEIVHDLRQSAPVLTAVTAAAQPVRPPATPPRTFDAYKPILDRNLFKSALAEAPPPVVEAEVPEEVEESPLQAKLIATVVALDEKKSSATIEDLTRRERDVYRVDDDLMNEARIIRIERERVIVLRKGAHEKLSLYDEDGNAPARPAATPAPSIRGRVTAPSGLLKGLSPRPSRSGAAGSVMTAVSEFNTGKGDFRVMPNFRQGHIKGFRIFAVTPDSNWAKSGLRNGDVIESINGREVTSTSDLSELLAELEKTDSVRLEIKRGGKQQRINYGGDS